MAQNNTSKIGVATATIIGMNAMIGSGIFTAPAAMASNVGPAGILAYLFVIASIWFMAQSLARVAQLFPQEGSFYTYAKEWGGHTVGMIAGGSYIIGLGVAMGLLAHKAGEYLHVFFPTIDSEWLGIIALVTIVILNIFGAVLSQLGQHILIICTVSPLIVITLMCFLKADLNNLVPFAPYGFTNVLKATRIVIFGFFGFESATSLFNIVKKPEKNVPKALTYAIFVVGSLYTLFVSSIILAVPLNLFTGSTPLPETLALIFPNNPWIITVIHLAILSAILGTIHSVVWATSSLVVFLGKKIKLKPVKKMASLGFINQKTAVVFVGLCILLSNLLINKIDLFFSLAAIFIICTYIMGMIPLLLIKKERKGFKLVTTIIGIATAILIFIFAAEDLIQEIVKSIK